jgi:hypothetical protein
LSSANKDQKDAIAKGMAQAAKVLAGRNDQADTNKIQQAALDTKDMDVILAFGDQPIGAGGGGGGGGSGGASGGQTNALGGTTGTGSAQDIPGSSTPTGQFSYTSSVGGTGSTTSTTTGTTGGTGTTNLFVSVSP